MEKSTGVRFDDVAGVDEAKAELQEIAEFLKRPKKHGRLGGTGARGPAALTARCWWPPNLLAAPDAVPVPAAAGPAVAA